MKFKDLITQHAAYSTRYSTFAVNRILESLTKSDRRITREIADLLDSLTIAEQKAFIRGSFKARRLIKLRESIRELAQSVSRGTSEGLLKYGKDLAEYEIEYAHTSYVLSRPDVISPAITATQAYAAAIAQPMNGRHIKEWVADLTPAFRRIVDSEIRLGFQEGISNPEIIKRIAGSAGQNYRDGKIYKRNNKIDRLVRTSMNHYSNYARQQSFEAMGVKKVIWISTLDGRTSPVCADRDGSVYDINKGPRPPAHPNCRSQIMFYDKNLTGRRPAVASDKPLSQIKKEDRAGIVQQVNSTTYYPAWFKNQDAEFQRRWLGPTKYKLYKQGNIKFGKFVDPLGQPYTIQELRSRHAETFRRLQL